MNQPNFELRRQPHIDPTLAVRVLDAGRGKQFDDAVWTYEHPYDEHLALTERVAFYDEKLPGIQIK